MPISQPGNFKNADVDNSFGGDGAADNNLGDFNLFVGTASGKNNTGDRNTFLGSGGPQDNVADDNVFVGYGIAPNNSGTQNTVIGSQAFANNQGGLAVDRFTVVGAFNMAGIGSPVTSANVVSIGDHIGQPVTSSQVINRCVFVGQNLATEPIGFADSVVVGVDAGGGQRDVIIGVDTFNAFATVAADNVIIGYRAAQNAVSLTRNVFIGAQAGLRAGPVSGVDNVVIGFDAGNFIGDAVNNTYIGNRAGNGFAVTGSDNIMLGVRNGGGGSGNVYIGRDIVGGIAGTADDTLAIQTANSPFITPLISGNFADANVGLNVQFGNAAYAGGEGVLAIGDNIVLPGTPPTGGILYIVAGELRYIGSGGTVTVLGAA